LRKLRSNFDRFYLGWGAGVFVPFCWLAYTQANMAGAKMRSIFVPSIASWFYDSDWRRHKKGGVNDLGKLRSGVKRNEAILSLLILEMREREKTAYRGLGNCFWWTIRQCYFGRF